jgi:prolipoprotein diacylglyceryltransferase
VVYGPAHVDAGLPSTYAGRVLIPVQLLEAGAAAMLVLACLFTLASTAPAGVALTLSLIGYAGARFGLELLRGDLRPRIAGLSEAQWTALAVTVAALVVWVSIVAQA